MSDWAINDDYKLAANPEAEGEYMGEFTFADMAEFKIVGFDGETMTWYPEGMDNNFQISEQGGDYTVYFRPEGNVEGWFYGFFSVVENVIPEPEETITIYVINKLNWEKVFAYIWRLVDEVVVPYRAWPGIEMNIYRPKKAPSFAGIKAEENELFVVEFPKEYDQIVFSNGEDEQTVDLMWEESKPYFVLSEETDGEGHHTGEWTAPTPTDIDNTVDAVKAVKVLRNDQIFIIRNGKTFDITGKLVK